MNILVSGSGGVRTDFVQQWLIRAINDIHCSWEIDSFTGRTFAPRHQDVWPDLKIKVDKVHLSANSFIDYAVNNDYDKFIFIAHDPQNLDECTKKVWEFMVKTYLMPNPKYLNFTNNTSTEDFFNAKLSKEIEQSIQTHVGINKIPKQHVISFNDVCSYNGCKQLAKKLDIPLTEKDILLWNTALDKSHSPDTVYHASGKRIEKHTVQYDIAKILNKKIK